MSNSVNEIMIPPNTKRGKLHNQDRLSDLSDCVLLHILSYLNTKHAVQTCILSPRWKYLWKSTPTLILHSYCFSTKKRFATFVSKVLTFRDTSTALHALDLERIGTIEPQLVKKILKFVSSNNTHIQQLSINVVADRYPILNCVSSCRALTSLKLHIKHKSRDGLPETLFPKSLNLPALTNLDLTNFTFCAGDNAECADPFTTFNSLNSLTISDCCPRYPTTLSISNATLVNLTMRYNYGCNIKYIKLSTPSINTFSIYRSAYPKLCGSGLSSVKRVIIDVDVMPYRFEILLNWLQDLANVKSLTVGLTALKLLSFVPNLFKVKLHSLCNLKSLKVKVSGRDVISAIATIPVGTVDFLLQNSPTAEVNLIDHWTRIILWNFLRFKKDTSSKKDTVEKSQPNTDSPPQDRL